MHTARLVSAPLVLLCVVAFAALPAAAEPDASAPPVGVPPVGGEVVADFDPPDTPWGAGHRGVDLAASAEEPVRAVRGGTVTFAGEVAGVGWVTVNHGGGLDTTYGNLGTRLVERGEQVAQGQALGLLATGAQHLDWGARLDGAYVDPRSLLGGYRIHLLDPERLVEPTAPPTGPAPVAPVGADGVAGAVAAAGPGGMTWPAPGRISSGFGYRVHPITGVRRLHAGVDVAAPTGTTIVAALPGRVSFSGTGGGYGLLVKLDHGGGLETRYAHASRLLVSSGQQVAQGQPVALVGSTGMSTGPHLHFEVRRGGAPTDPLQFRR